MENIHIINVGVTLPADTKIEVKESVLSILGQFNNRNKKTPEILKTTEHDGGKIVATVKWDAGLGELAESGWQGCLLEELKAACPAVVLKTDWYVIAEARLTYIFDSQSGLALNNPRY